MSGLIPDVFQNRKEMMTKDDYVIVCGDFGGVWMKDEPDREEMMLMDWLDCKPFYNTVCGWKS